jgi:hypothetical protein
MKVYVAARFYEKRKVRQIYKKLKAKGHTITTDWTIHKDYNPQDKHPEKAIAFAIADIDGVKNCDVLIMLTSEVIGPGSSGELGAGILSHLLTGKPKIYVVGKHMDKNLFYFHPSVTRKDNIEDVLEEL